MARTRPRSLVVARPLLAVVVLLLSLPALSAPSAGPATPAPASADDPAIAARALALRLLPPDDGESLSAFLDERIDPTGLTAKGQGIVREELRAFTRQQLENGPDGLYARIARLYTDAFTPAQIAALLELTESPDAQRLADWLGGPGQERYIDYFRRLEPQLPQAIAEACKASHTAPAACPAAPPPGPAAARAEPPAQMPPPASPGTVAQSDPAADAGVVAAQLLPPPPRPADVAAVLSQRALGPHLSLETLPDGAPDGPGGLPPAPVLDATTTPPPSAALATALRAALLPRAAADAAAHAGSLPDALRQDLPAPTLAALARFARTPGAPDAWQRLPAVQARVPDLALELFTTRGPRLRARICEKLLAAGEPVGGFRCDGAGAGAP